MKNYQLVFKCIFFIFFIEIVSVLTAKAQNVNVNATGGTAFATYSTLKGAFDAINIGTHTGVIGIDIVGNTTETDSCSLKASGTGAASYTYILIKPSGGVTRTISGSLDGKALISLAGADNVTIDGINSGGNALTLSNTSTSTSTLGTATIKFRNDASFDTIRYCTISGFAQIAVLINGGTIWFADGEFTGNDNNVIHNCDIGSTSATTPRKAIFSIGSNSSPAIFNSNNKIENCNIFNFFGVSVQSNGIYLGNGNSDWFIISNKFYQTASRTQTTGSIHAPIQLASTDIKNCEITNNVIGYSNSSGTGTYSFTGVSSLSRFYPIYVSAHGTIAPSSLDGNIITAISMSGPISGTSTSSPFAGILVSAGTGLVNIGNTSSNTVGSSTTAGSISFSSSSASNSDIYGIYYFPTSDVIVSNNNVGGISAVNTSSGNVVFYGIRIWTGASNYNTIQNNNVGFVSAPISLMAVAASSKSIGIYSQSGISNVTGNNVNSITMNGANVGTNHNASLIGIWIGNSTAVTSSLISQNTIHSLYNSSTVGVHVTGIVNNGPSIAGNIVERNFVHSLKVNTDLATINGINANTGIATYKNNMIRLGIDDAGASVTFGCKIHGIIDDSISTSNFYHNSIYIGGSASTGSASTFALKSTITSNTRDFVNNIYQNSRSNSGSTGKHYAVQIGGSGVNPAGLTANRNIFYSPGSGGIFGLYNGSDIPDLTTWQSNTGQDANSFYSDPQYNVPNGNASTVDLHLNTLNPTDAEGNGLLIASVTDDYDGNIRLALSPTDIGADAGNFVASTDVSGPIIYYTPLASTCITGDRVLSGVIITDATGVPTSGSYVPRIYFRKNSGSYFSQPGTFVSGSSTNSVWDFTITASLLGGVSSLDKISYYVIAQDLSTIPLLSSYPVGTVASDVLTITTHTPNPDFYYDGIGAGTYTVGTGGNFSTLTEAVNMYNNLIICGPVIFELTDANYTTPAETFPITIKHNSTATLLNNLTIRPQTGMVSVTISSSDATASIYLNGADFVNMDGRAGGAGTTVALNITNTNTTSNSTCLLKEDATSNTIQYCNLAGSQTVSGTAVVLFSGTAVATGNDYNTIQNCAIHEGTSGTPVNGIYSLTTVASNDNNTIQNNNIYNYYIDANIASAGVLLSSNNDNWTISGNSFYQTVTRNPAFAGSVPVSAIYSSSTLNSNLTIENNFIGGTQPGATGGYMTYSSATSGILPRFIRLTVANSPASNVNGNIIRNFNLSTNAANGSSFGLIQIDAGSINIGNTSYNLIGDTTSTSSLVLNNSSGSTLFLGGIFVSSGTGNYDISNNKISGINFSGATTLRCIYLSTGSPATFNVNNNLIGSRSVASSINTTNGSFFYGIVSFENATTQTITNNTIANYSKSTSASTGAVGIAMRHTTNGTDGTYTITDNIIRDFDAVLNTTTNFPPSIVGIWFDSINTGSNTIARNAIFNLRNTTTANTAVRISGIHNTSNPSAVNIIEQNFIHGLSTAATSNNAIITGILTRNSTNTVRNNMIRLGLDASGNSITGGYNIFGIVDSGGTNSFYHNSIYIGGGSVNSVNKTYAFRKPVTTGTTDVRDNIFQNERSNSSGSANNVAFEVAGTLPTITGLTSDANIYKATGTGGTSIRNGTTNYSLGSWQTATTHDDNSFEVEPYFINATGNSTAVNLHIDLFSPNDATGILLASVTQDFDGELRSGLTPTDIGADAFNGLSPTGDDVCSANQLNIGLNGPYSNLGCTIQAGEPQAPNTNCMTQSTWCDGAGGLINNTVWFKFTAPPSGRISIHFINPDWDSQIAIWAATDCNAILNGGASLIAANDDSTNVAPWPAYISPICLTPGQEYFVQVDGHTNTVHTFSLLLIDEGAATCVPGDNVCQPNQLVVGLNGPYTNVGATVQYGEPQPPASDCNTQNTWCPSPGGIVNNTVWFKFTAPTSGGISIHFSPDDWDSQIAVWDATNCNALLTGGATLVAANDDQINVAPWPAYIAPICVIPGHEYFVQVDGHTNTVNPAFSLLLIDETTQPITGATTWYLDNDNDGYGNPAATPIVACNQPVGYVPNNNDCNDNNPAGHIGPLKPTTVISQNTGVCGTLVQLKSNQSLSTDGPGSPIHSDFGQSTLNVSPGAMPNTTWEAWVYPTSTNGTRQTIMSSDDGDYDRTVLIELGTSNFGVFHGGGVWQPVGVTFNQWQHIAVVYSPTNIKFYKNGVEYVFGSAGSAGGGNNLAVGSNPGLPWQHEEFTGQIDEVRIWNLARTQIEIQMDMDHDIPIYTNGLVAYWRMNSNTGNSIPNEIGASYPLSYSGTLSSNFPSAYNPLFTYSWTPSIGLSSSTTQNTDFTASSSNSYSISVSTSYGCSAQSDPVFFSLPTIYPDLDGDSYGSGTGIAQTTCPLPTGYSYNNTDCNDIPLTGANVNPGVTEICNGIDDDCDGIVDEGFINPGNALNFDGTNDYINVGNWWNFQEFTFQTWIKPASSQVQYANIVDDNHSGGVRWVCQQMCGTNCYEFALTTTGNGASVINFNLNANVWQHLTLVKSLSETKVYINGTQIGSGSCSGTIVGSGIGQDNIFIGNWNGGGRYFNGSMDEIRMWNYALSPTEITDKIYCELTGSESGLVCYYKLNQGIAAGSNTAISTAFDSSPLSHDGTLNNFGLLSSTSNFITGADNLGNCGVWYADNDDDGFGNAATTINASCNPGTGYSSNNDDCDDTDDQVYPGATEICNGIDDDCDGQIDEGVKTTYYNDDDGDGFGNNAISQLACSAPLGFVTNNTDCDDTDEDIWQSAIFYIDNDGDGYDNGQQTVCYGATMPSGFSLTTSGSDCNDNDINKWQSATFYVDFDNDDYDAGTMLVCYGATIPPSFKTTTLGSDCNDNNNLIHALVLYYVDADNDGYGSTATAMLCALTAPAGYASNDDDCDDTKNNVYPGAPEICDGLDNDCNSVIDDGLNSPPVLSFFGSAPFTTKIINKLMGMPGDEFIYQVIYTDAEGDLPAPGYPRVNIDFENNGLYTDANDRLIVMQPLDLNDNDVTDGKTYFCQVTLLYARTNLHSSISVIDNIGCPASTSVYDYPDIIIAPDIEIFANDISFTPTNPNPGDPVIVNAVIHNNGSTDANNIVIHLINELLPLQIYADNVISIPAFGSTTASWNINAPNIAGWYPMRVFADFTELILESNEYNNDAVRPLVDGNIILSGGINVIANSSPPLSYAVANNHINICGSANYFNLHPDVIAALGQGPTPPVRGGTVTVTIVETGASFSGYTDNLGNYCVDIITPVSTGLFHVNVEVTDFTLTGIASFRPFELISPPCPLDLELEYITANVNSIFPFNTVTGFVRIRNVACQTSTPTTIKINCPGAIPAVQILPVTLLTPGAYVDLNYSAISFINTGYYYIEGDLNFLHNPSEITYNNNHEYTIVTVVENQPDISCRLDLGAGYSVCNPNNAITATVTNSGYAPVGPFDVNWIILDAFGNTFTNGTENVTGVLAANTSHTWQITPTFTAAGFYTVKIEVDATTVTETELSMLNNAKLKSFYVKDCYKDLSIEDCNIKVNPSSPMYPGNIEISAKVENNGDLTITDDFFVDFFVYGNHYPVLVTYDIPVGGSKIISFLIPMMNAPGIVTVTADYFDNVTENGYGGNYNNSQTGLLCYDFELTNKCNNSQDQFWDHPHVINTPVTLNAYIRNNGLFKADSVRISFEVKGPGILDGNTFFNIGYAKAYNLDYSCNGCPVSVSLLTPYYFTQAGVFEARMKADDNTIFDECDDWNNQKIVSFTVTELPDYRVLSQYINPSSLNPGVNVLISFNVSYENIGVGSGTPIKFRLSGDNALIQSKTVPGLAAGALATEPFSTLWSSPVPGMHIIKAEIDFDDDVYENYENNNEATRAVIVGDFPDVSWASFDAGNVNCSQGCHTTFNGQIQNTGNVSCDIDVKYFYVDNQGTEHFIYHKPEYVPGNATVTVSYQWQNIPDPNCLVIARITDINPVEADYTDNEAIDAIGNLSITFNVDSSSCLTANDGFIEVYVSGGQPPLSYLWSNGKSTSSFLVAPGLYSVIVTDANGYTKSASVTLNSVVDVTPPAISNTPSNITVYDTNNDCGEIVNWALPIATDNCHLSSFNSNFNSGATFGIGITNVIYTATDASGNSQQTTFSVTVITTRTWYMDADGDGYGNNAISIINCQQPFGFVSNNLDCNDTPVYGIDFHPGAIEFCNNLDDDCDGQIDEDDLIFNTSVTHVLCKGANTGSITLNASNANTPYSYLWNNGSTASSAVNLFANNYSVTVSSANGCIKNLSFTITQPALVMSISISKTTIRCGGASTGILTALPAGGGGSYTYLWSNGSTTASIINLPVGTYTVSVTDNIGCTKTKTILMTQNVPLLVNVTPAGSSQAYADVTGGVPGYSYVWNTNPSQTNALATGLSVNVSYKVKVTDSKGCTKIGSIVLLLKIEQDPETEELFVDVFPNPTDGLIYFQFSNMTINLIQVTIHNALGKKVFDEIRHPDEMVFDFSKYAKGLYTVNVQAGDKIKNIKVAVY